MNILRGVFISLILWVIALYTPSTRVLAVENEAVETARLVHLETIQDPRVETLKNFLSAYNPNMVQYASVFVSEADRVNIDWRLVAAISGVESTFCKQIPFSSYNCWGWNIPTGASDGTHFENFPDGIAKVSEGLRFKYFNRGLITIDQIGSTYAASPTWAYRVKLFMQNISSNSESDSNMNEITFL